MIWYIYLLTGSTYKDEVNKISVGKEGLGKVRQCVEEKLLCEIRPEQRTRCYDAMECLCDVSREEMMAMNCRKTCNE